MDESQKTTEQDMRQELTDLEYQASQRPLNQDEQNRLNSLRQNSQQLIDDIRRSNNDLPDAPGGQSTIVNGDDSPL